MREILFRGKKKINDEWIYGYYFQKQNVYAEDGNPIEHCISDLPPFGAEIIPETVGQYTGLTDKSGTKIFEGDIVKIPLFVNCKEPKVAVVVWNKLYANFGLEAKNVKTDFYYYFGGEIEIIGNIHDNPELLKGGEEE